MARQDGKKPGADTGRVTPKGTGATVKAPARKRPNILAIVLIAMVLLSLIGGAIGTVVGSGNTTATSTIPATAPPP